MAKPGGDGDGDDEAERLLDEGAPLLADGGAGSAAATEDDRAAARQRRRAELQALALMITAGALLNGGYNPSESYRSAVFGALGYYSSFVLYIFMAVGNLFVPWVVGRMGVERTMSVGAVLYLPFGLVFALAVGFNVGESLFIPFSVILGCGASVLRTTQVVYVTERSRGYDSARRAPLDPAAAAALPSSLGFFNGVMQGSVSAVTVTLDM